MALPIPAHLYRTVRLVRSFEEAAIALAKSGEIAGGVHPYIGQEAVAAGVCGALELDDLIASTHRGHGHVLAKGASPRRMLAELLGRESGLNRGRGGSMHAADVSLGILGANGIVGAGGPIACGAAWAAQRAGQPRVAVSFFGDGAVNQGVLLESFNLASLLRLPVVFVCENNGYAVTLPVESAVAGEIPARAAAFGIRTWEVDGMDPEVVHAATTDAVRHARSGAGPCFLACRTYRFDAHHTRDHMLVLKYRTSAEVDLWRRRDPLEIQGARIAPELRAEINEEIANLIRDATEFALASPAPDPSTARDYLYAGAVVGRGGEC
jgi:pyruvate dehydrogenase E1 component alpha subunit